jgi:6-pyruvoyl-tetrahydropterin synthase related domain
MDSSAMASCGTLPALLWSPLATIAVVALAVELPFLHFGMPSGHDVEFHLYSWLEVLTQWQHGIFVPRWAELANFGYGEPRFLFYPPASWSLGAALTAIFPVTIVAAVYIWIALTASGISMFALSRRWLSRRDALFAAALYAANPYHLVIVYWRSAFAELLASCLVPLLLLFVLKAADDGRRMIVPLAVVLAAAWLTNAPAAVMIHYSFALLIVIVAWQKRSVRALYVGVAALVLGAVLAGFYLLPAVYEQRWITIAEAVSAGSRPADNFLFVHTTDADHDAFNRIISWVATAEMGAVFTAAWAARRWGGGKRLAWYSLAGWAAACSVLMLPVTGVLWNALPKMKFMQFPWRWLLCLSMICSLLIAIGVRRWWTRAAICLAMLLVVGTAWRRIQSPWWDTAGDLREMQDNVVTGAGYEGTDEYTPVGAEPAAIDKVARNVIVDGGEHASIRVLQWNARSKVFVAELSGPSRLALRLFNYPAWQVMVNGHAVQTAARENTGQMLIPVRAGVNRVQIRFVQTWDRTAGAWISLCGLLILLVEVRPIIFVFLRRARVNA